MAQNDSMMDQNGPQNGSKIGQAIPNLAQYGHDCDCCATATAIATMTATAVLLLLLLLRAKEKPKRQIWL
jgi:hypothetical protein